MQERLECSEGDRSLIRSREVAFERLDQETFDARPVETPRLTDLAAQCGCTTVVRGDLDPAFELVETLVCGGHQRDGDRRTALGRGDEHACKLVDRTPRADVQRGALKDRA
jgi:hypothetical protein